MLKKIIWMVLLVSLVLSACGKKDPALFEEEAQKLGGIMLENIQSGLPLQLPSDLKIYEGVEADQVYVDTTINMGKNFFYATNAQVSTLVDFYLESLQSGAWELLLRKDETSYTALHFQKGKTRLNVSIYPQVPSTYPEELDLEATFVTVLYDFTTPPSP